MATFKSVKELTRGLQQGAKLLNDMFLKRKTVAVKYDDAVETLDGDEKKLDYLLKFGIVVQTGDTLEYNKKRIGLDMGAYLRSLGLKGHFAY